jgi:hypothetical protein
MPHGPVGVPRNPRGRPDDDRPATADKGDLLVTAVSKATGPPPGAGIGATDERHTSCTLPATTLKNATRRDDEEPGPRGHVRKVAGVTRHDRTKGQ